MDTAIADKMVYNSGSFKKSNLPLEIDKELCYYNCKVLNIYATEML